jgi:AcrR family transcriptional regulator
MYTVVYISRAGWTNKVNSGLLNGMVIKRSSQARRRAGASPPAAARNAAATRAAILAAAKFHFSRESYDQAGLREIATRAGVNVALVSRYFGSKEQLFLEAFTDDFHLDEFVHGDRSTLGERFVRHILQRPLDNGRNDALLILFRSASNEKAVPVVRDALRSRLIEPLAAWLGGADAQQRAGLIAAHLLGLSTLRVVLQCGPLNTANVEMTVRIEAPILQALIG